MSKAEHSEAQGWFLMLKYCWLLVMLSVFPTAQGEGWQCHGGSAMPSLHQVEMQQLTKMHGFHQEMV